MLIRRIAVGERASTVWPLQAYAFRPSPWTAEEAAAYDARAPYFTEVTTLIAEEDGQTLAGVAAFPMRQNVRGRVLGMAGVASVASAPESRRRGYVRALLTELHRQMREGGCAVAALHPFRPSFYGRFGYVGIPRTRTATLPPAGLEHLLRAELPGEVRRLSQRDAYDDYRALTLRLVAERHGFSVFGESRAAEFREGTSWVAVARSGDEVVGAVRYRIADYNGDLEAGDLLTTGPLGRALLLQFFARHVDQVARVVVKVGTDEVPELWGTDLSVTTEATVAYPYPSAPMARVLDLAALDGLDVGSGDVTVEVVDDELIGGTYRLAGDRGALVVEPGADAAAQLTTAGISGLVYGVLDPVDVVTRGFGSIRADAVEPLRALFPRRMPYLFSDF